MLGPLSWIGGVGVGAGLMYLLDPERGRRRRVLIQDKINKRLHRSRHELDQAFRDTRNRVRGLAATTSRSFDHRRTSDAVLAERIRSRLGRAVTHPGAIQLGVQQGHVTVSGPVLRREIEALLEAVRRTPGVTSFSDQLERHDIAEDIPSLQGEGRMPRGRARQVWKPRTRLAAAVTGGSMLAIARSSPGLVGKIAGVAGAGMLLRSTANRTLASLVGLDGNCEVRIQKTLHVRAPAENVYAFWNNYSNFPRFMSHIQEVRDLGDGRSHWVAHGPAGIGVGWDARITKSVPNKLLAWKSEPDSRMETWGQVRFEPDGQDGTRITVQMAYRPPAGTVGHMVASVLGVDPKSEIDADFVRLKALLEQGLPAGGETAA